ncbi:MAG: tetratricopeptide repeat protein, partial [Rhodobacteraceae bacterium]|nr:tetratricopeptide repeat protein [Paracoccaceae bacterium]
MPAPQDTAARLAAAVALHQNGDVEKAEEQYLGILADDPNATDAHKMLALVALGRGDFDEALSYLDAATSLAPNVGEYWHLLGRIHLETGDSTAARDALSKAVAREPMDPLGAQLDLSLSHARCGDWQGALDAAEAALAADPNNVYALRAAANAALTVGRDDLAQDRFERVLAANPSDAETLEGLARLDRKRGDPVAALIRLERALALEPDNAEFAYMRRVVAAEAVPAWH